MHRMITEYNFHSTTFNDSLVTSKTIHLKCEVIYYLTVMIIENLAVGGLSLVFALISYAVHMFALLPVAY